MRKLKSTEGKGLELMAQDLEIGDIVRVVGKKDILIRGNPEPMEQTGYVLLKTGGAVYFGINPHISRLPILSPMAIFWESNSNIFSVSLQTGYMDYYCTEKAFQERIKVAGYEVLRRAKSRGR